MIEEKLRAIRKVLESGDLSSTHGNVVEVFESRFSKYVDCKHAIAVNSGTAALHTALLALGIGEGDEVIVPAWTFLSTVSAVLMCGATPVFADISEKSFNIGSSSILGKLTHNTKAVIVVHLGGIPANLSELNWILKNKDIALIEDACQSLGAEWNNKKVGTIGDIGVYSFFPSKIITTGEGGMIVTNRKDLAYECQLIRDHGRTSHFYSERLGFNYRMTEIQGALGCVELKYLDERITKFRAIYNLSKRRIDGVLYRFPEIPKLAKIAPTFAMVWRYEDHKPEDLKFYTPLYKLPPFKQDIELKWTEYASKRATRLRI